MKVKILPSPLWSLNLLFPQGVPVLDGVALSVNSLDAYVFDPSGVDETLIQRAIEIASTDSMPAIIVFILMSDSELVIPKEWVCTDEQSITASW